MNLKKGWWSKLGELFRVPNFPDLNLQDTTVLTADANSAQDEIKVIGVEGMAVADLGLIGAPGFLAGEIHKIDTITADTIKFVDDLINSHRRTEPFTIVFGDRIRCYRALNINGYPPIDASFVLLSTTDIDQDSPITLIKDNAGSSLYWYKFTYYNSVSTVETPLTNSLPVRGGGFGHYVSGEDIRREAGLMNNQQIADTQIAARRDHAESEVNGVLRASGYALPLRDGQGDYYTPGVIENISRLLAAGYVLIQDYGPIADGNSKDGKQKLDEAHALLKQIQERTLVLTDSTGQLMASAGRLKGLPDDSSPAAFFTVTKKF